MRSHRKASRATLLATGLLCSLVACTFDRTDWELTVADDDQQLPEKPTFGVGLAANLSVCLQQHESHLCTPPRDLQVVADDPSKVRITIGGIVKRRAAYSDTVEENDTRLVQVEALAPGPNRLRFIAADTEEVQELSYEARAPVTFTGFATRGSLKDTADAELWAFAGSNLSVRTRFSAGGTPVVGSCPWKLTAPAAAGTTLDYNTLRLGSHAHDVTLECEGASSPLRIHVRFPTDIVGIHIEGGVPGVSEFDGTTLTIQQGYNVFPQLAPLHASGARILGWPHPSPSVSVDGGAIVSLGDCTAIKPGIMKAPLLASGMDCLGFHAEALGESTLHFSWSSAVRTVRARVVPKP